MSLQAPILAVAMSLMLACRTTSASETAGAAGEPAPALATRPELTGYPALECPAGSSAVALGLTPGIGSVTAEELGLPGNERVAPEVVTNKLPGARLDGCRDRTGQIMLARIYLRLRGKLGQPSHLMLVVDPDAQEPQEDVVRGIHTLPTRHAEASGVTRAFEGDASALRVRLLFGDETFPTALVVRGVQNGAGIAVWLESADGAAGFTVTEGPIFGKAKPGVDPFAADEVCPYGWTRASARYGLGRASLELDACEINHDLVSGEPSRSVLYRALRITDPGLEGYADGVDFPDEETVASVLMFQAGDLDGCDDLEITLPGAEYRVVIGPRAVDCLIDQDPRPKGDKPAGSIGPYRLRYGDEAWQAGWAEAR